MTHARAAVQIACSLPLLLLTLLLLPTAPAQAESVVLIQESNGFPGGTPSSALARQQIVVDGPRLRVLDTQHMWALFIDLDGKTVQEAAIDQQEYVERKFSHYKKYADERAQNLQDQAAEWKRQYDRAKGDDKRRRELVAEYVRMGGDPKNPGNIVAKRLHLHTDTKTVTLLIDREPVEVTLEHYLIRENQAQKPIFDLWTTTDVELPTNLMRFYRQLGTFSPQVTAELTKVPGTVIECTAWLDTGTLKKKFESRILEVRKSERVRGSLTVPAGWKKVEEKKQPKADPAAAPQRLCEVCQALIRGDKGLKFTFKRRRHWVCSQSHRVQLIKRISAAEKRKKRRRSSSGQ